jgi:membrane fusion protein (multidrug efflux system)
MKKNILLAIAGLAVVIVLIGGIKGLQIGTMMGQKPPVKIETVTAAVVKPQTWESTLSAVGSLVAVQGVTVAAEMAGKVDHIAFEPGSMVRAGDLLVQQDVTAETAQLRSAEASLALAKINYERAAKLLRE